VKQKYVNHADLTTQNTEHNFCYISQKLINTYVNSFVYNPCI